MPLLLIMVPEQQDFGALRRVYKMRHNRFEIVNIGKVSKNARLIGIMMNADDQVAEHRKWHTTLCKNRDLSFVGFPDQLKEQHPLIYQKYFPDDIAPCCFAGENPQLVALHNPVKDEETRLVQMKLDEDRALRDTTRE